jgi:hypothetical protein
MVNFEGPSCMNGTPDMSLRLGNQSRLDYRSINLLKVDMQRPLMLDVLDRVIDA